MSLTTPAVLSSSELERRVQSRTGWRVTGLLIEVNDSHVVLRGRATTCYARLLAQRVAQDLLPHLHVDNAIVVDGDVEVLGGMPLH